MVGDHKEDSAVSTAEEEETKETEQAKVANETELIDDDNEEDSSATIEDDPTDESLQKKLVEEIEQIKKEKDELYDRMLRIQAEFDNYKRRTTKERAADRKYKSQDLASELLPALDNFERALAIEKTDENKSVIEGISMVYEQIQEALKSEGIEPIETTGEKFDPNLHHAVMQVEDEDEPSQTVVEELQKGYKLKDRVIRAAMVKVNK